MSEQFTCRAQYSKQAIIRHAYLLRSFTRSCSFCFFGDLLSLPGDSLTYSVILYSLLSHGAPSLAHLSFLRSFIAANTSVQ